MNWKMWAPLLLAVVLGLAAMKITRDMIARRISAPPAGSGTAVIIARSDLPAGTKLSISQLGTARMSGDMNADAVFTAAADLEGRVLAVPVLKGTPVVEPMLAPKGSGSGLQALIPEGMRAITVEVDEVSGVAGNLLPGCRVDVVATINGESGEMVSRTIVQNIRVQAVGMRRSGDEQSGPIKSVTLIATPKEAETIELAAATAAPRLILRGTSDERTVSSEGVTVAALRAQSRAKADPFVAQAVQLIQTPAPASQPADQRAGARMRAVKIIRAGVESDVTIEEPADLGLAPRWITGASVEELPLDLEE